MSALPALVIAGPGTNRDRDLALALQLAGAEPTIVLATELAADPKLLAEARLVGIAGGFSYGDALGAGRMLALDLMVGARRALSEYVATGRPLIGICNGFQVLTRAGLLPGALGHNAHGRFECRWVVLAAEPASACLWTQGIDDPIHCPIAHGEGRYVHPDPARWPPPARSRCATARQPERIGRRHRRRLQPGRQRARADAAPREPRRSPASTRTRRSGGEQHLGLRLFRNGVAAAREM